MAIVRPPVPDNYPPVGSEWYCQKTGGWPGWWKQTARLGSLVVVTEHIWLNNQWKIRFNVVSNSLVTSVGNTETISNFYTFFGTQKVLCAVLSYHGGGYCDLRRLQQVITGRGRAMGRGLPVQPLVHHALSATGGGSSITPRLQPYRLT